MGRPDELVAVCHWEFNEGTGFYEAQDNLYGTSRAKFHVDTHKLDYYGRCGAKWE